MRNIKLERITAGIWACLILSAWVTGFYFHWINNALAFMAAGSLAVFPFWLIADRG